MYMCASLARLLLCLSDRKSISHIMRACMMGFGRPLARFSPAFFCTRRAAQRKIAGARF